MKVLFCTDGSQISFNALENYTEFAHKDNVIDVISVIDWSFLPDNIVIEDTRFLNHCQNMADDILNRSEAIILKKGFQTGTMIKQCGNPAQSIIEHIKSFEYDCVILGSHGKKGIQKWIGSVSNEVLESVQNPVYISKNRQENKRILFITNNSEYSIQSVQNSIKKIDISDCEIYICTMVETPELLFLNGNMDQNWLNSIQKKQDITANNLLDKIRDLLPSEQIKDAQILYGNPAQNILKYVKNKEINLIITDSKRRDDAQKFYLDSTSRRIIDNTNSDIFVNFML